MIRITSFLGVLEEAEFYNITELIGLVKDKIRQVHQKNQVGNIFCQNLFQNYTTDSDDSHFP